MWKKVTGHALYWDAAERSGSVLLTLEDGGRGRLRHLSRADLAALGEILREEPQVWYHTTRGDLSTERVPEDEEEHG